MAALALNPQDCLHSCVSLKQVAYTIIDLGEYPRVVMEASGLYHESVASALHKYGVYVSVLNSLLIKQSGGGFIWKVNTDKADTVKTAKYSLVNRELREYTPHGYTKAIFASGRNDQLFIMSCFPTRIVQTVTKNGLTLS